MYKQAIVIRSGLRMSKGKIAAQACHAAISSAKKSKVCVKWELEGQKKVVLKADIKKIMQLRDKCKKLKIPFALITDAGLTEVSAGSITALGIGPEKEEKAPPVTCL